jgi:autotransporter-associated beta strand protein
VPGAREKLHLSLTGGKMLSRPTTVRHRKVILAAAFTAGFIHANTASAATHTWSGATNNDWNTATNWTSNAVPNGTGEDVVFATPTAANLNIVANAGTFTVRTLTFNNDVAATPITLTLDNAHTFSVNGTTGDDIVVQAGAQKIAGAGSGVELKLTSTDFNIADSASLEITARINQGSSSNSYSKNGNGTLILNAQNGGGGGWNFTGGTFTINGGVLVMKTTQATGNSGNRLTVNNGGTLEFQASSYVSTGGVLTVNNGGTLRATGGNRSIGAGNGSVNFASGAGTIDVVDNTFTITQDIGGSGTINKIGAGTLVLNDGGANAASNFTGQLNIAAGTASIGANGSAGASPVVNVQSGGAFNVTANSAYGPAANQTLGGNGTVFGAVTLSNSGSTIAPGLIGTVGQLTLGDGVTASPLTLNGGRVHFDLSNDAVTAGANDKLVINGDLNLNAATRVAINRLSSALQSSSTYTLMTYTGALNGSASNLVLPIVRQGLSIVDPTTTPGQIQLAVGNGSAADITWVGDNAANVWEANGAANFTGTPDHQYFDWDNVTFDDTGSHAPSVAINTTLVPNSITLNTTSSAYSFGGSGTLTNVNSVTKNGAAAATFGNSGVNLFNALTVNGGTLNLVQDVIGAANVNSGGAITVLNSATFTTLSIADGGTLTLGDGATSGAGIISGNVTNNGTVVFNRPDDFNQTIPLGGSGSVIKNGNGVATLSANGTYSGQTFVNSGTVHPTVSSAFGATGAGTVTVASGAVLDIGNVGTNSLNFGPRVFVVSGNGTGSGVIINNTTNTGTLNQQNAFQKIQLAGDATFGGNMRFDVRANQSGGVNVASLDLAGYTLTKVGNMQLSLVAADVSDGNIVVNNGTLSIETTTKLQGSSSVNFSGDNTALQFFANPDASLVTRPMFFNGNGGTINQAAGGTAALIGSNMILNKSVTIQTAAGALGHLTLSGNLSGAGGITKMGINSLTLSGANTYTGGTTLVGAAAGTLATAGTLLTTTNFSNGTLSIASGTARVAAKANNNDPAGVTIIPALTITGGTLDLTNNAMIVNNGDLNALRTSLANGYAAGAWNGANSISSSSANAVFADANNPNKTALGYGLASTLGLSSFAGQSVVGTDVLVRYTLSGDANLDGKVNAMDFNLLASNFGAASLWTQGDFDFDGQVTSSDFSAIAANFNASLASAPALGALVPEPGIAMTLLAGAAALVIRRRRNM